MQNGSVAKWLEAGLKSRMSLTTDAVSVLGRLLLPACEEPTGWDPVLFTLFWGVVNFFVYL